MTDNAPITITVPGEPRGKGRPRFTARGHAYTPAETRAYERRISWAARQAMGSRSVIDGPVSVHIRAVMEIPKSWAKHTRTEAVNGLVRPVKTPDIDNAAKAVFDALNTIVWRDDKQITDAHIEKRYGIEPGLTITVRPLTLVEGVNAT